MKAVYKKELKAYFQSIIGCVFIAFLIAFTGIYFMAYNMTTGYPYFSYTLSGSLIVFIVGIPLITMRSFAEERKNKTDQILLTAPVSLWKVVVGKYLAMVTVIAIPNLIFCIFPLIIKLQGTAYLTVDYISILMFFLLGCVFAAIGMLLSALTESQIIAYIGTFGIFLILYLWDGILSLFPNTAMSGLVFIILLILLAAFYIWRMTNSFSIAGGVGCVGVAVAIAVYFLKETLYENLFTESLGGFALTNIFTDITQNSIVDVSGIVLYLSMITLFLFLTVQSIRRRLWESAAKKHGAYSVTMTAVFLAITVVINLIACQIPEKFRKIDVSNTKIYEISDTTEDFLKEMDKEISMKIIAVKENTDERIVTFLSKYAALSNKIHMEWIDPVLHPSVLSEYETTENTIVISCEETGKNTTVSFDDILENEDILKDIDVIINVGDGDTAHTGGAVWENPVISSAIRRFVYEGGGFIGIGEPAGHQYQGHYLQLADLIGVEKETGFTLNYDKYNWDEHPEHFILADTTKPVDFGEGKKSIYAYEGTEILVQREKEVQMAVNGFGAGRSVYISGLPYSFENSRILYRSILWSTHSEEELHQWYSTNFNVEVHAYVKNGKYCVVNNTYEPQKTTVYRGDGSSFDLEMEANEIKWYTI